jgi:glycosyltransferase involved in cell wall biosynthesis
MNITLLTYTFSIIFKEFAKAWSEHGNEVFIIGRTNTFFRDSFLKSLRMLYSGLLPVFTAKMIRKMNAKTDVFFVDNINGVFLDKFISKPWVVDIPSVGKEGIEILNGLSSLSLRQSIIKYISIFYAIPQVFSQEYVIKNADLIVTPCNYTKEKIVSIYKISEKKIHVYAPGVNVHKFKPAKSTYLHRKLGLPRNAKIILCVGRVTLAKGFFSLLNSFQKISNIKESYLVIVGPCPLKNLIVPKELSSKIKFTGPLRHHEMPKIYNSAYLLVHPSYFEGTPLCILEAMASGIPIVARAVGGIPEIISNNNQGFLVCSDDEMMEKIELLLADDSLAMEMGMNGRRAALKRHRWERSAISLLKEFQRML